MLGLLAYFSIIGGFQGGATEVEALTLNWVGINSKREIGRAHV